MGVCGCERYHIERAARSLVASLPDVVAVTRRSLNTKKVGHCGTLDPMATGLLIVVIGKATKIQDLLMAEDKEYEGTISLGATTSTHEGGSDDGRSVHR